MFLKQAPGHFLLPLSIALRISLSVYICSFNGLFEIVAKIYDCKFNLCDCH